MLNLFHIIPPILNSLEADGSLVAFPYEAYYIRKACEDYDDIIIQKLFIEKSFILIVIKCSTCLVNQNLPLLIVQIKRDQPKTSAPSSHNPETEDPARQSLYQRHEADQEQAPTPIPPPNPSAPGKPFR